MNKKAIIFILISNLIISIPSFSQNNIEIIEKSKVHIKDGFWASRLNINNNVTLPHILNHLQSPGFLQNFRICAGFEEGIFVKGTSNASDDVKVFKYLEGEMYSSMLYNDTGRINFVTALWDSVLVVQQSDGYLCTRFILGEKDKKFNRIGYGYQMYIAGHFIEAAIAHYKATKNRKTLDAAIRFADLIDSKVGPEKSKIKDVPGHQEIELALIKLYRITQNERYLQLSKFFIEERGKIKYRDSYGIRRQDHKPLLKHREAVGHAVRATYSYAAMTDIASITGDTDYINAINRLWQNVVSSKLYITGAIGSRHINPSESLGTDYELPNREAYAENCGNIGLMLWNWRMYQFTGDKKYFDVIERTLYNVFLAGTSLKGNTFCYCNPLQYSPEWKNSGTKREPWWPCPCCPPNIARMFPQIPELIYAKKTNSIFVNLFINSLVTISLARGEVNIYQESDYPWDGKINIWIEPGENKNFTLLLRVPGWALNQPVPSDLYKYLEPIDSKLELSINNEHIPIDLFDGYLKINRTWEKGDKVTLNLPMPIRRVICHKDLIENRGKIALEKGPIIYCLEAADNQGSVLDIYLPDTSKLSYTYEKDILNGCGIITGEGYKIDKYDKEEYIKYKSKIIAIPYFAWQNRGLNEMNVWINSIK